MSEAMTLTPEQFAALLARSAPAPAAPALPPGIVPASALAAASAGWGAAPAAVGAMPAATGLLVPVKLVLPDGRDLTVQLQFGPEYATPQGIQGVVGALLSAGVPVKAYEPRNRSGWGGGGGGWNNRGGGGNWNNGNGGRWGRGGY